MGSTVLTKHLTNKCHFRKIEEKSYNLNFCFNQQIAQGLKIQNEEEKANDGDYDLRRK